MLISKKLLIHSITLETITGTDRDGNDTRENVEVTAVRCSPSKAVTLGAYGLQPADRMTLIYDPVQSSPAGLEIKTGDLVTFNGEEYRVREVKPRYTQGSSAIHHYSIGLV